VAAGGITLTALTAVALARYPDAVEWGTLGVWALLGALGIWAAVSAAILVTAARHGTGDGSRPG
jgi:hypothetical protein